MSFKEKLLKMAKSAGIVIAGSVMAGLASWISGQDWGAGAIIATAISSWLAATAKTWLNM